MQTNQMQINTKPEFLMASYAASRKLGLMNVTIQTVSETGHHFALEDVRHILTDVTNQPSLQSVVLVGNEATYDPIEWNGFDDFCDSHVSKMRMKAVAEVSFIIETALPLEMTDDLKNRLRKFDVVLVRVSGTNTCSDAFMNRIRLMDHPNVHVQWSVQRSNDEVQRFRQNWRNWQSYFEATQAIRSLSVSPSVAARKDATFWKGIGEQIALINYELASTPTDRRLPFANGYDEATLAQINNNPEALKKFTENVSDCAVASVSCFITPSLFVAPCRFVAGNRNAGWTWNRETSFVVAHAATYGNACGIGYAHDTCRRRCSNRNFQMNCAATMVQNAPLIGLG